MITPLKLLITAAIVYVLWLAFKYRSRIAAIQREMMEARAQAAAKRARKSAPVARDLVPCPKCGAYVAAGAACTCEKV
jgi:hypothetical protein